jgi:hypothetical protein
VSGSNQPASKAIAELRLDLPSQTRALSLLQLVDA